MPGFPEFSPAIDVLNSSVYAGSSVKTSAPPVPLHIGDTWMEPPAGCRMEDLTVTRHPGMHRYTPVPGLPALRQRLAERQTASSESTAAR